MRINLNQIPAEGLRLSEEISPKAWDLATDSVLINEPLNISADISRITNTITAEVNVRGKLHLVCSRCLEEFVSDLNKDIKLHYQVAGSQTMIDLDPDIREEVILEYPFKPLCKADCKGLCPKCGKNLNQGGCTCGST